MWLIACGLLAVRRDPVALTALGAFVLTCIGGHPLLVAEPSFVFGTLLGAAAGAFHPDVQPVRRPRKWLAMAVVAILVALPWRMQSAAGHADLEHVGIGLSSVFSTAPDGTRYKEAHGHGTLFVPADAPFRIHINPQADRVVRVQLLLAGRLADIVTLEPGTWNAVTLPVRSERATTRFVPLEFRAVDDDKLVLWITKVETLR